MVCTPVDSTRKWCANELFQNNSKFCQNFDFFFSKIGKLDIKINKN